MKHPKMILCFALIFMMTVGTAPPAAKRSPLMIQPLRQSSVLQMSQSNVTRMISPRIQDQRQRQIIATPT